MKCDYMYTDMTTYLMAVPLEMPISPIETAIASGVAGTAAIFAARSRHYKEAAFAALGTAVASVETLYRLNLL